MTTPDLLALADRVEKLTGPDRDVDLAINLALVPDSDISRLMKYRRGLDSQEGYAWTIHLGSVIVEKWTADGRCPFNAGYPLPTYTASLDAAMTLVPEGLAWTLGQNVHHGHWQASVNHLDDEGAPESVGCSNATRLPALALSAACLRALTRFREAQAGGEE